MIKYSRGLNKNILIIFNKCKYYTKVIRGIINGYYVYRPFIDHSVYENDNVKLGSTTFSRATIVHQVSMSSNKFSNFKKYIIEIEHPFALFGHLDEQTDYRIWKANLSVLKQAFINNFNDSDSLILCTSNKCLTELNKLFNGFKYSENNLKCLHWSTKSNSYVYKKTDKLQTVFHYAGRRPISKGTLDIILVAKQLKNINFIIVIDLSLEICDELRTVPNIELVEMYSKRSYLNKIKSSDVVICPTYLDGWGIFLDALTYNKPIISYNSYDKNEIVYHGYNGFLIEIKESFYDNFFENDWKNLIDYEKYIENRYIINAPKIITFLSIYQENPSLIDQHGYNSFCLAKNKFNESDRISSIKTFYSHLK